MGLQGGAADGGGERLPRVVTAEIQNSKVRFQKSKVKIPALSLQNRRDKGGAPGLFFRWQHKFGFDGATCINHLRDLREWQRAFRLYLNNSVASVLQRLI